MFILFICSIMAYGQQCPSNQIIYGSGCYNASCINNYRQRLGVLINSNQSGVLTLPIKSTFNTTSDGLNLYITYQDDINDHLLQRENPLSCLTYHLNIYSISFNRMINDLTAIYPIQGTYLNTNETTYHFYIPATDYQTSLIQAYCVDLGWCYIGYFGFDFYIDSLKQASFQIRIVNILNSTTNSQAEFSMTALIMKQDAICNDVSGLNCTQKISTNLRFCNDSTCQFQSDFITPLLNSDLYIIQKITNQSFKNWILSDALIQFQGNGAQFPVQKVNRSNYDNSVQGQIIIRVRMSFILNQVTIQVSSILNAPQQSQNRMLMASEYDGIRSAASSNQIQCILEKEGDQFCPNCESQKRINGFSQCAASKIIIQLMILFLQL